MISSMLHVDEVFFSSEERYAAQIQIHVFDLEKDDLDTLREVLKGLEVGILGNL